MLASLLAKLSAQRKEKMPSIHLPENSSQLLLLTFGDLSFAGDVRDSLASLHDALDRECSRVEVRLEQLLLELDGERVFLSRPWQDYCQQSSEYRDLLEYFDALDSCWQSLQLSRTRAENAASFVERRFRQLAIV